MAILHHPAVADVVVAGRPSERWGNEVVAIVQVADGPQRDSGGDHRRGRTPPGPVQTAQGSGVPPPHRPVTGGQGGLPVGEGTGARRLKTRRTTVTEDCPRDAPYGAVQLRPGHVFARIRAPQLAARHRCDAASRGGRRSSRDERASRWTSPTARFSPWPRATTIARPRALSPATQRRGAAHLPALPPPHPGTVLGATGDRASRGVDHPQESRRRPIGARLGRLHPHPSHRRRRHARIRPDHRLRARRTR